MGDFIARDRSVATMTDAVGWRECSSPSLKRSAMRNGRRALFARETGWSAFGSIRGFHIVIDAVMSSKLAELSIPAKHKRTVEHLGYHREHPVLMRRLTLTTWRDARWSEAPLVHAAASLAST